jgi:hypothetical protein
LAVAGRANAASGGVDWLLGASVDGPIVSDSGTDAPGAIGSLIRPAAGVPLPELFSAAAVARGFGELKA